MKSSLINSSAIGLVASVMSFAALAAPITDIQDYSNNTVGEYFVDSDANKYSSPYYRNSNQDWGWTHNAIAGSGFSSIILEISAFDVDFGAPTYMEHDMIEVFDGSSWLGLGDLAGGSDIWAFTSFDLTGYSWAETQVNAGLQVRMDIDRYNSGWLVTLGKSTLSIDGGSQTCVPTPGVPCTPATSVPEPSSLGLLALSLLGLHFGRKHARKG